MTRAGPCRRKLLPPHEFTATMLLRKNLQNWLCKECEFPACIRCRLPSAVPVSFGPVAQKELADSKTKYHPSISGTSSATCVHTLPVADAALNGHGTTKRKTPKRGCGSAESASGRPLRQSSSTRRAAVVVPTSHANSETLCTRIKLGAVQFAGARQTAKMSVPP